MIPGGIDDPRGFGGVAASSAATKLKAFRERSYLDTFEIPSQWKDTIAKGPTLALTGQQGLKEVVPEQRDLGKK